jgi:hypothetical protein
MLTLLAHKSALFGHLDYTSFDRECWFLNQYSVDWIVHSSIAASKIIQKSGEKQSCF